MAERVGGEIDGEGGGIDLPVVAQVFLRQADVTEERFAVGHILVGLDPGGGGDLPSALADPLQNAGLERGRIVVDDLIHGGLGLREGEGGVLVHDPQHGGECGDGGGDGLVEGPHPVHVNMGVTDEDEGVFARGVGEREQDPFAGGGGGAGDSTLGLDAVGEEVDGALHEAVKFVAPLFGQAHGVFKLGEDADDVARGRRDVALFLARHAERELVTHMLAVPGDLLFQRGEFCVQIGHGGAPFVKGRKPVYPGTCSGAFSFGLQFLLQRFLGGYFRLFYKEFCFGFVWGLSYRRFEFKSLM